MVDIGALYKISFKDYKNKFKSILLFSIIIGVIYFLINIIYEGIIFKYFIVFHTTSLYQIFLTLLPFMIIKGLIIYYIFFAMVYSLLFYIYDLKLGYSPQSFKQYFKNYNSIFLKFFGTTIVYIFLVFLGFLLLVFPGFLVVFFSSFYFLVVFFEKTTGFDAIKRSFELLNKNFVEFFVGTLILSIIFGTINFIINFITNFLIYFIHSNITLISIILKNILISFSLFVNYLFNFYIMIFIFNFYLSIREERGEIVFEQKEE